ncbi:hypothetical protein HZH66_000767 [Vespula vulgaris]|uniref:Uncharacterized protein n=1 Tax=Vespula vulgaris TaxID=7454 RepID=A0A834KXG7_VESVU|nr:hypothetical protein HZH66_000767 [Vespula vulgaris]
MQQPPRGGTWVGSTCAISKSHGTQVLPGEWLHILKPFPKSFPHNSKLNVEVHTFYILSYIFRIFGGSHEWGSWAWASVRVSSFSIANRALFSYTGFDRGVSIFLLLLFLFMDFDISAKGSIHNRLLDANTGRIVRTLARVSVGTSVMFSGAIKSPTVMDYV